MLPPQPLLQPQFQSTRPMRGATHRSQCPPPCRWHFNPRAPCGARQRQIQVQLDQIPFQSTRPMRGATTCYLLYLSTVLNFNPRAPCGARPPRPVEVFAAAGFQSTRPMRGATPTLGLPVAGLILFQSTRPMRGATDQIDRLFALVGISIHAPHAGRDAPSGSWSPCRRDFNPRAPCGARPRMTRASRTP